MREDDPNILVDLTDEASAFQAEVTRCALEASGIPAFAATTAGTGLAWELAASMPMRVQVRRCDHDAAVRELEMIRKDAAAIDWSTEDLGQPESGEVAAIGPGESRWAARFLRRRSRSQLMIWVAVLAWYGRESITAAIASVIRMVGGDGYR